VRYTEAQSQQFFQQVAERTRQVGRQDRHDGDVPSRCRTTAGATPIAPEGFQFPAGKDNVTVLSSMVDEHYFETMGITLSRAGTSASRTTPTPRVSRS
jgi:hypothetical protein